MLPTDQKFKPFEGLAFQIMFSVPLSEAEKTEIQSHHYQRRLREHKVRQQQELDRIRKEKAQDFHRDRGLDPSSQVLVDSSQEQDKTDNDDLQLGTDDWHHSEENDAEPRVDLQDLRDADSAYYDVLMPPHHQDQGDNRAALGDNIAKIKSHSNLIESFSTMAMGMASNLNDATPESRQLGLRLEEISLDLACGCNYLVGKLDGLLEFPTASSSPEEFPTLPIQQLAEESHLMSLAFAREYGLLKLEFEHLPGSLPPAASQIEQIPPGVVPKTSSDSEETTDLERRRALRRKAAKRGSGEDAIDEKILFGPKRRLGRGASNASSRTSDGGPTATHAKPKRKVSAKSSTYQKKDDEDEQPIAKLKTARR